MSMKDYWVPISLGLLAYLLISYFYVLPTLFALFTSLQVPWVPEIAATISKFNLVIPGLVVGYLAKKSGILLGAVVGFVGVILVFSLSALVSIHATSGGFIIEQLTMVSLMNAVGGGCGELIRIKRYSLNQENNEAV